MRDVLLDLIAWPANKNVVPTVVLLNDDAISKEFFGPRGGRKTINDLLCQWAPQTLIRDEAHCDLNAGSVRSQALRRLSRLYEDPLLAHREHRTLNGFKNLYAQMAILDPDLFGTNKSAFMQRYTP